MGRVQARADDGEADEATTTVHAQNITRFLPTPTSTKPGARVLPGSNRTAGGRRLSRAPLWLLSVARPIHPVADSACLHRLSTGPAPPWVDSLSLVRRCLRPLGLDRASHGVCGDARSS